MFAKKLRALIGPSKKQLQAEIAELNAYADDLETVIESQDKQIDELDAEAEIKHGIAVLAEQFLGDSKREVKHLKSDISSLRLEITEKIKRIEKLESVASPTDLRFQM